jgi:peroxiredoxin (alkyl hydroperoxide reductase subunit C)
MKTLILTIIISLSAGLYASAQVKNDDHIPLLGEMTPEFTAQSTQGKIKFPDDYFMKWKVLFSHPADFTPVCSTELLELAAMQDDFDKLNTKIIVISTDGLESHEEWVRSLESMHYKGRNPVKINFPLVSDKDLSISRKFGMIHSYTSNTRDVRGVFIIDPNDRIRVIFFYPDAIGRNLNEILRTLVALQTAEKKDVLLPANWNPGDDVLVRPSKSGSDQEYLSDEHAGSVYSLSPYLWFRKMK